MGIMFAYKNVQRLFLLAASYWLLLLSSLSWTTTAQRPDIEIVSTDMTKRNKEEFHDFLQYISWFNISLHGGIGRVRQRRSMADFTDGDKEFIIDFHNRIRASLGASNMIQLEWNSDLEAEANRWASLCDFNHPSVVRRVGGFNSLGQNLFVSSSLPAVKDILESWNSESKDYEFKSNTCNMGEVCGHYTQMVWANSEAVGCAVTFCDPLTSSSSFTRGYFAVCEYGPGGNQIGQAPYTEGTSCSACPGSYNFCQGELCALTGTMTTEAPDNFAVTCHDTSSFVLLWASSSILMILYLGVV